MILFSLFNKLVSFQSYFNKILAKNLNIFIIFYLKRSLIYINEVGYVDSVQYVPK